MFVNIAIGSQTTSATDLLCTNLKKKLIMPKPHFTDAELQSIHGMVMDEVLPMVKENEKLKNELHLASEGKACDI